MAYSAPSTRSTGELCTAAIWNADVVANEIAIYAGALSVTSQAVGDILYASSTTQFARVGIGSANKVLTSSGSAPQWSTQLVNAALPTNIDVGGTLDVTGATTLDSTLAVSSTAADAIDVAGGITAGTGNVALVGTDGKLSGPLSSTIIDDLSGANLTTLNASNVSSGTLANARLPSNVDLGGTLDVTGATTLDSTLGVVGAVTFNDASADVDFRVESGDVTHMLFVDGGYNGVGIGMTPSSSILGVTRTSAVDSPKVFQVDRQVATNGKAWGIDFTGGTNSSINAEANYAYIYAEQDDVTNGSVDGTLLFGTALNQSTTTKMVLTNAGHLGVGTPVPAGLIDVAKDTDIACYLGKGYVSSTGTSMTADRAYFGHVDNENASDYALMQTAPGATNINAKTGNAIWFLINANATGGGNWSSTGFRIGDSTAASALLHVNGVIRIEAGDLQQTAGGVIAIEERDNPGATASWGKIWTKSDNKLYFQSGDGSTHEIAFA